MAIFYPPPPPAFPRPQVIVTQVTPAGAFVQPRAGRSSSVSLLAWVAAYAAPQRLQAPPIFPAPPAAPDLSFLRAPSSTSAAILTAWFVPVVVPMFTSAPPPQSQASSPLPPVRNAAFEGLLETVPAFTPVARLGVVPIWPAPPPPPDLSFLFNPAVRLVPSVVAQFRALAEQPVPTRLRLVPPQIGVVSSLVLPASSSPSGAAARIVEQVWLAPINGVIRLAPVPLFPLPPAPPTPVLPPRNRAFDAVLATTAPYLVPARPMPPPIFPAPIVVVPPPPESKLFLRKRGDARRYIRRN